MNLDINPGIYSGNGPHFEFLVDDDWKKKMEKPLVCKAISLSGKYLISMLFNYNRTIYIRLLTLKSSRIFQ